MTIAEIKIKSKGVEYTCTVDTEDLPILEEYSWCRSHDGYAVAQDKQYYSKHKKRRVVKMHRLIMQTSDSEIVDHADGNKLNNCKSNLRICTKAQNGQNSKKRSGTVSKYKGVYRSKGGNFFARIVQDGKIRHLGTFKNEEDAAKAYDEAAERIYGEFARLNLKETI